MSGAMTDMMRTTTAILSLGMILLAPPVALKSFAAAIGVLAVENVGLRIETGHGLTTTTLV